MRKISKLGFTLIELLVVITIIWILATGATAVYTSQIQKSRDATRVSDLKVFQSWLEQLYWDLSFYPGVNNGATPTCSSTSTDANLRCLRTLWYMPRIPADPKKGSAWNWSALDYTYAVWPSDGILKQVYEVSMWVESNWQKLKADVTVDNWNDNNRYEVWMVPAWINTRTNGATTVAAAALNNTIDVATTSVNTAIPKTVLSCNLAWGAAPATSNDTTANQSSVAIIRWNCQ